MLNLDKFQMDWVCNHLGHTKSVHKEHYRQMSGLVERTQISKLLLIQDMNLTSKFRGKKLEDMDIKGTSIKLLIDSMQFNVTDNNIVHFYCLFTYFIRSPELLPEPKA